MIRETRHPIDGILADLGTIVRRAQLQTLDEDDYLEIATRIRAELVETGADPDGIINARLTMLELMERAGSLTPATFREVTGSIRVRLMERRDANLPVVPNFAVLPSGIHGRRIGWLTVVDGDLSQPTLKGA